MVAESLLWVFSVEKTSLACCKVPFSANSGYLGSEIGAVFLAEDRTFKVGGFLFDLYPVQPVLST